MMKRISQVIVLCLSVGLLTAFVSEKDKKGMKIGTKATLTDVKMPSTGGMDYSLSDLKQKNGLIVVFSCNTCPFVVGSSNFAGWEKDYNALNALAQENEIGFVLVNSNEAKRGNEDSFEAMQKKAKEANYSMPYVVDKESKLADAYGAKTTPHVYFFNGDFELVFVGSIDNTWDTKRKAEEHYLKDAIARVGAGKKISVAESEPRGCSIKRVSAE